MNGLKNLQKELLTIPSLSGVYLMKDADGEIIYVGKAKNLKSRIENYTRIFELTKRIQNMVFAIEKVDVITTKKESEALLLEANLIKKHKPKFNIALKDDKTYPYICIDKNGDFPRIFKFRGKKKANFVFFGPFSSATQVNMAINSIQKAFLIRPCTDSFFKSRTRPCIEYEIKRCSAPCTGLISSADYKQKVAQAENFLKGRDTSIKDELKQKMESASSNMEYEKAGFYRDRIMALSSIHGSQHINFRDISDADVIGVYKDNINTALNIFFIRGSYLIGNREVFFENKEDVEDGEIISTFIGRFYQNNIPPKEIYLSAEIEERQSVQIALSQLADYNVEILVPKMGSKKELVEKCISNAKHALKRYEEKQTNNLENIAQLQSFLETDKQISRIEVYDNSHLFGMQAYGVMVVADENGFQKNLYRKFSVDSGAKKTGGDDYFMMHQVIKRRILAMDEKNKPSLIIIDGGKGQLNEAIKLFKQYNISDILLLAMAKGEDRNAGNEDLIVPNADNLEVKKLPKDSKLLHYLQILRDEAHNFAISSHRSRRNKDLVASKISDIPSIGAARKRLLLNYFGSFAAIKEASIEELMKVEGISKNIAKTIKDYFGN